MSITKEVMQQQQTTEHQAKDLYTDNGIDGQIPSTQEDENYAAPQTEGRVRPVTPKRLLKPIQSSPCVREDILLFSAENFHTGDGKQRGFRPDDLPEKKDHKSILLPNTEKE